MKLILALATVYRLHGSHERNWRIEDRDGRLLIDCEYRDDPTSSLQPTFTDYIVHTRTVRGQHEADLAAALALIAEADAFAFEFGERWIVSNVTREQLLTDVRQMIADLGDDV